MQYFEKIKEKRVRKLYYNPTETNKINKGQTWVIASLPIAIKPQKEKIIRYSKDIKTHHYDQRQLYEA